MSKLIPILHAENLARFLYLLVHSTPVGDIHLAAYRIERMEPTDLSNPGLAKWARDQARKILNPGEEDATQSPRDEQGESPIPTPSETL